MNKKGLEQALALILYILLTLMIIIIGTLFAVLQAERLESNIKIDRVTWEPGYLANTLITYQPTGQHSLASTAAEENPDWQTIGEELQETISQLRVADEKRILTVVFFDEELVLCITPTDTLNNPNGCGGARTRAELIEQANLRPDIQTAAGLSGLLVGVMLS